MAAIPVPDSANELADDILCELRKSMAVSDRKYLGYYPIAQARAWLSGHDKVESSDLLALKDYLWHLPADREKVESVLKRLCINPMQEKVNGVREVALDSQAGFEEACGDGQSDRPCPQGVYQAAWRTGAALPKAMRTPRFRTVGQRSGFGGQLTY